MTSNHTAAIEYDELRLEPSPASEAGASERPETARRLPASMLLQLAATASILTSGVGFPPDMPTTESRALPPYAGFRWDQSIPRVISVAQARRGAIATLLEAERRRREYAESEARPTAVWEDPE